MTHSRFDFSTTIGLWLATALTALAVQVDRVSTMPPLEPAAMHVGGRTLAQDAGRGSPSRTFQWPGTYFETVFVGRELYFRVGSGDVVLHVVVDGENAIPLMKPAPGLYRVGDLSAGQHAIRIAVATESQSGPDVFGGFAVGPGTRILPMAPRSRQIEFIGDSYTVGYGNTSATRQCTKDEVWSTTDNTQAFGPLTARHYDADYQTNAISGRGIVRNYNGFIADPLPVVYPFVLFDKKVEYVDPSWRPQLIVIGLGGNDFSTDLHPGEKWKTRAELQADYEATYVKFVQELHARHPGAFIILETTQAPDELEAEVNKVKSRLQAAGITRITYIPVAGLAMSGCDWHPSVEDDKKISNALVRLVDAHPEIWTYRGAK